MLRRLRAWLTAWRWRAAQARMRRQRRDPYVRLAASLARIHDLRRQLAAERRRCISLAIRLRRRESAKSPTPMPPA